MVSISPTWKYRITASALSGLASTALIAASALAQPTPASPVPATYGSMNGNPIPTPLLIPPGFHAKFLTEPVRTTQLDGATFADGGFWTVTTGYPATLEEVVPATGKVAVSVPLPGAYGAWAVAAGPNQTIWAGTFHKGMVYSYSLVTHKVRIVGELPRVNTVWAFAYDPADSLMWAGTYPDGIWTIDPTTGAMHEVGKIPGAAGPHAMALVGSAVLAGAYPFMDVVTANAVGLPNLSTGGLSVESLLGQSGQVRAIGSYEGHTVILAANGQLVWMGIAGSSGYQTLSDVNSLPVRWQGQAVVIRGSELVGITPGVPGAYNQDNLPIVADLASLPAGKYWSAYGVSGGDFYALASNGTLVQVSPPGHVSQDVPALTAGPGIIQSMAVTPAGLMGGGYLGGNVWRYADGLWTRYTGLNQVDSLEACGQEIYMGVYPNARLYAYRPSKPWNPPTNPKLVGSPGETQDRVPGMACVNGTDYVGTVPQNAALGGMIYASSGRTYPSPIAGETPVSLAADGPDVAGSLSNQNALGTARPNIPSHLFLLHPKTGKSVTVSLGHRQTFAGTIAIGGSLYAASRQYIARWNPASGAVSVVRFSRSQPPAQNWGFTTHFFTARSHLYLVDDGWLYLVNPKTLATTRLFYGVQHAAVDGANAYFTFYKSEWVVEVPTADLTVAAAGWPWNFWYTWKHDGHRWPKA